MRGSLLLISYSQPLVGIIPASAGLTSDAAFVVDDGKDHPRECGAHLYTADIKQPEMGSSPRVRGSPLAIITRRIAPGIIPASAGLTGWYW